MIGVIDSKSTADMSGRWCKSMLLEVLRSHERSHEKYSLTLARDSGNPQKRLQKGTNTDSNVAAAQQCAEREGAGAYTRDARGSLRRMGR